MLRYEHDCYTGSAYLHAVLCCSVKLVAQLQVENEAKAKKQAEVDKRKQAEDDKRKEQQAKKAEQDKVTQPHLYTDTTFRMHSSITSHCAWLHSAMRSFVSQDCMHSQGCVHIPSNGEHL